MVTRALIDGTASALPLDIALSVIPTLPRALLARLVERAIERLDELDGDPDLELTWHERHSEFAERNPPLAYVNDDDEDGHDAEPEIAEATGDYGKDQRVADVGHGYQPWHVDRERVA